MTPLETSVAQHLLTQLLEEIERVTGELNVTRQNLHAAVNRGREWEPARIMELVDEVSQRLFDEVADEHAETPADGDEDGMHNYLTGRLSGITSLRFALKKALEGWDQSDEKPPETRMEPAFQGGTKSDAAEMRGMADCMHMVREELIEAGVVDASVPPMFLTDAIIAHIRRQTKKP